MLFGGHTGKGLEPMGIVCRALFNRPILHGIGDHICNGGVDLLALLNGFLQRLEHLIRQALSHDLLIKDHVAKDFRNVFCHGALHLSEKIESAVSHTKRVHSADSL